jgi:DNA-binding beta-propeller fold protein YncE
VSDGAVSAVTVFDRRTLAVQSSIPIGCSPDSLAYDPSSKLVFAVCGAARSLPQPAHQGDRSQQPVAFGVSHLVAIDTAASNAVLADVAVPGELRVVQTDGNGRVYVTAAESRLQIARNGAQNSVDPVRTIPPRIVLFDSSTLVNEAHRWFAEQKKQESDGPARLDVGENNPSNSLAQFLRLPAGCTEPHGFAIDSKNARIFAACENQQLLVLNAGSGQVVATLTTGPGDDVIGYDADHNLIFSANGAGYGSLTIIRQDATADTYAVIQNLPTLARARTLAVDPSTGIVYLVTDTMGVDLSPRGALTNIKPAPIEGSFQVVVVGH